MTALARTAMLGVVVVALCNSSTRAADEAPRRRPNVVVILADDLGFSDLGCYGGEIRTPHVDALAKDGVRFAQFYNMARCCPTRASLLTGLYPHQAGLGAMNQDLGRPGYEGRLNERCVTVAEALREAGYQTGMAGKWHLVNLTISAGGPRAKRLVNFEEDGPISPAKRNWPVNRGFQEHWGTIAGVDSFYDPYSLVHDEQPIPRPEPANDFYYTDFITDRSVEMVGRFAKERKPFFLYVAYTAPHWPMQAREADVARYADAYTIGWDRVRAARFERQVAMGLVKREWGLSPRPDPRGLGRGANGVTAWEDAEAPAWQARRMAVYAAMVESMDRGVGRIVDKVREAGVERDTVVVFLSDNGACAENVQPGWYDVPSKTRDGRTVHVGNDPSRMPGPEETYQSYGPAWANASNTPLRRFKHWAEEGGISTPFVVKWPAGVTDGGRIERDRVGHVIDLMPTILEMTGAPYPKGYRGRDVLPMEGTSLVPAIRGGAAAAAPANRGALFWEHEGNRAVRVGDWKLVAGHGEAWQLYDVVADRTEMKDLAKDHPEKVAELKASYEQWAARCGVEPWPIRRR